MNLIRHRRAFIGRDDTETIGCMKAHSSHDKQKNPNKPNWFITHNNITFKQANSRSAQTWNCFHQASKPERCFNPCKVPPGSWRPQTHLRLLNYHFLSGEKEAKSLTYVAFAETVRKLLQWLDPTSAGVHTPVSEKLLNFTFNSSVSETACEHTDLSVWVTRMLPCSERSSDKNIFWTDKTGKTCHNRNVVPKPCVAAGWSESG